MRVVYLGNNDRGVRCLEALTAAGHHVAGVVAHPDPSEKPWYASVRDTALSAGIPVIQPADVSKEVETIRRWEPELLVLVGYTQIIRRDLIEVAPRGVINLHGGKLPEYRGASTLNWMIINGETEGGVSILRVDEGVDTGDVLAEERFPIGTDDTIRDVLARSLAVFPPMLLRVLDALADDTLKPRKQDPSAGRTWPKRHPDDGTLDWTAMTAHQVHNRVRALTRPYPGAFSHLDGRRVFIWRSRLTDEEGQGAPGEVLACSGGECLIACRKGAVAVSDLTGENGDPVTLEPGARLG